MQFVFYHERFYRKKKTSFKIHFVQLHIFADQVNDDSVQRYMQLSSLFHYENLPMQYIYIFSPVKIEHFIRKKKDIFLIFAQNIDCGYTLEPPVLEQK